MGGRRGSWEESDDTCNKTATKHRFHGHVINSRDLKYAERFSLWANSGSQRGFLIRKIWKFEGSLTVALRISVMKFDGGK